MNKLIFLMVLVSIVLMSVVIASPQLALITTGKWSENTIVNISTKSTNDDSQINTTFITIRFSASDTANSSTGVLINITNTTATNFDLGYANFTFGNNLIAEDTLVASVTGLTTGNTTAGETYVATTFSAVTINFDRTKPSTPTTTQAVQSVLKAADVITYTVTGTDTTKCVISFQTSKISKSSGTNTFAMVHSGDTCTYTIPQITIGDSVYSMSGWASDGTNASFSSIIDIEIDNIASNSQDISEGVQIAIGEEVVTNKQIMNIVIIIVIVGGAYWFFTNSGSGKKK